jgi:hypothetical protein
VEEQVTQGLFPSESESVASEEDVDWVERSPTVIKEPALEPAMDEVIDLIPLEVSDISGSDGEQALKVPPPPPVSSSAYLLQVPSTSGMQEGRRSRSRSPKRGKKKRRRLSRSLKDLADRHRSNKFSRLSVSSEPVAP